MMAQLLMNENYLPKLTELFGAIADPTRVHILLSIMDTEKRSGDLATVLDMTPSAVSHQLRWLRDRRIVTARKEGREMYYALADDCIREIIEVALKHIKEGNQ
jgi:ArsR family transcriptional regulator, lead/cadmium/zinc/bismuth-responsive transcriptional repressor